MGHFQCIIEIRNNGSNIEYLIKRILDGDDGKFTGQLLVELAQLLAGDLRASVVVLSLYE